MRTKKVLLLVRVTLPSLETEIISRLCPHCEAPSACGKEITGDNVDPDCVVKQCPMCNGFYYWDRSDGGEKRV